MEKKSVREAASFLRDAVFAANDGVITTFAVVAGAQGASLGATVVIVLGFANLFADGVSMASGIYLGVKSEVEYEEAYDRKHAFIHPPLPHGLVTFASFIISGLVPLLPYLFDLKNRFIASSLIVAVSLFFVGALRTFFTKKHWLREGSEMFFVGGLAAVVAYLAGFLLEKYVI